MGWVDVLCRVRVSCSGLRANLDLYTRERKSKSAHLQNLIADQQCTSPLPVLYTINNISYPPPEILDPDLSRQAEN